MLEPELSAPNIAEPYIVTTRRQTERYIRCESIDTVIDQLSVPFTIDAMLINMTDVVDYPCNRIVAQSMPYKYRTRFGVICVIRVNYSIECQIVSVIRHKLMPFVSETT